MAASTSHPDLLGGWDAWAEAPAPTPATEGKTPAPWRLVQEQHLLWSRVFLQLTHDVTVIPLPDGVEDGSALRDVVPAH